MEPSPRIVAALDTFVRADLTDSRDDAFGLLLVFTFAVALGVAIEVFDRLPLFKRFERIKQFLWWAGWLLVLVGVIGEGVEETMVSHADSQIQAFETAILLQTQQRALDAEEIAWASEQTNRQLTARLDSAIVETRLRAAELEAKNLITERVLEEERHDRAALEASVAGRSLSIEQQKSISGLTSQEALRSLFAAKIVVGSYMLDAEALLLAGQIANAVSSGGANVDNQIASVMPAGGFVFGVSIMGPSRAFRLMDSIGQVLHDAGVDCSTSIDPAAVAITSPITIWVGPKPVHIMNDKVRK